MNIKKTYNNDNVIVSLYGELNEQCADELKRKLDDIIKREDASIIILEFANVSFMNSTGVGIILAKYNIAKRQGKNLMIANPNRQIDKVLSVSGLYNLIQRIYVEV